MQYRSHASSTPGSIPPSSPLSRNRAPHNNAASADQESGWRPFFILTAITSATCFFVYFTLSPFFFVSDESSALLISEETHISQCCRGTEHLEFWGRLTRQGTDHVFNTSFGCCKACKDLCPNDDNGDGSLCLCNSWVYCSDPEKCENRFGECWLKMQDDPLNPDVREATPDTMWTSGLVYGKDVGIVALETELGSIRIKLLPECAPTSVTYLLELTKTRHCAGCHFYRAEGRGNIWDETGNRVNQSSSGPPYALVQGTLEAQGVPFKDIKQEACPFIKRGTVAWVENGPDFFISLSNHEEWYPKYTVFAYVLSSDMPLVEKLVTLPTTGSVWGGVSVSILNKFITFKIKKDLI